MSTDNERIGNLWMKFVDDRGSIIEMYKNEFSPATEIVNLVEGEAPQSLVLLNKADLDSFFALITQHGTYKEVDIPSQ